MSGQNETPVYRSFCCGVEVDDPEFGGHFPPECPDCGEYSGVYRDDLRSGAGQLCPVGDLPDSPTRLRAFQYAIAQAFRNRSFARSRVLRDLDLPESKAKSVQRGLSDACDAGWIRRRDNSKLYTRGPLTDNIVSSRSSDTAGGGGGR